jgi:hypothetical protein
MSHSNSYASCLRGSVTKAWTVDDCFQGRDFDFDKPFLPERIAGVKSIGWLTDGDKRMLNQIRGNSYCHIFAFVEEYIVPLVMDRARADVYGDETRLWSLLRFAEEEVKHQEMLRRAVRQFEAGFGVACGLVPGREEVAKVVLDASPLTALLLTSMIEWFTQLHYTEHVHDHGELDEPSSTSCSGTSSASTGSTNHVTPAWTASSSTRSRASSPRTSESRRSANCSNWVEPSTDSSPSRSSLKSTRCSRPPAVPSPTPSATRFAPTSAAPTAGPSSSRGSNTPTSSG